MRNIISAAIFLVVSQGLAAEVVELRVPPDLLRQLVRENSYRVLDMPEIEVFNRVGLSVFREKFNTIEVEKKLDEAITKNHANPERDIYSMLRYLRPQAGVEFSKAQLAKHDWVIVTYWSASCTICGLQMKGVKSFMDNYPQRKVLWLIVERDISQTDGLRLEDSGLPEVNQ